MGSLCRNTWRRICLGFPKLCGVALGGADAGVDWGCRMKPKQQRLILGIFAIMAVCLFGDVFIEFSDLGSSLFALLQVVTLDGWASNIARPVMAVFPHSWLFFVSFVFISFLITVSFLMSVVSEVVRRAFNLKSRL